MTDRSTGPACGNNPNYRMSDGDRQAVADFRAYLELRTTARKLLEKAVWVDGDPLMEAIASAVWEKCRTEHAPAVVVDDPRNIAAVAATVARAVAPAVVEPPADQTAARDRIRRVLCERDGQGALWGTDMLEPDEYGADADAVLAVLPEPADRAADTTATLDRFREVVRRLAAHAAGFQDVLDESDRGPWAKTVGADIAELRRMADETATETPARDCPACDAGIGHTEHCPTPESHKWGCGCHTEPAAGARQDGAATTETPPADPWSISYHQLSPARNNPDVCTCGLGPAALMHNEPPHPFNGRPKPGMPPVTGICTDCHHHETAACHQPAAGARQDGAQT